MPIHLFAGYVKEKQFQLSAEIKEEHWIPLKEIDSHPGPYNPDNALYITIKNYLTNIENKYAL